IGLELFIIFHRTSKSVDVKSADYNNIKHKYTQSIKDLGPAKAYEIFKQDVTKITSPGSQHLLAHVMGTELYTELGLEGLSVCDDSFAFGCYHSFLGTAINQEGLGILNTVDQICNEKKSDAKSGCQHGIGHGIIGYLGYDQAQLLEALKYCEQLTYFGPLAGCGSGVFMEYNLKTMADPSGSGLLSRKFDPTN